MRPDYYAVLGVPRDADAPVIRGAYRALAARYHPDKNPGDTHANARFKALVEAYGVLGDPARRATYDAGALAPSTIVERSGNIAEAIGGVFDRLVGVRDDRPQPGRNRVYKVTVPFVDAMNGTLHTLALPDDAPCGRCDGRGFEPGAIPEICERCAGDGQLQSRPFLRASLAPCPDCGARGYVTDRPCRACDGAGSISTTRRLEIRIPPGVSHGQTLRVRGAGEPGRYGGADGDCLVHVSIMPHRHLRREGRHLIVDRPVSVFTAIAGGVIRVPTLRGARTLKVPAGVSDGATLRLAGHGLPDPHGAEPGDLLVRVALELPRDLDDEARAAVADLAARLPADACPADRAFDALYAEDPDETS